MRVYYLLGTHKKMKYLEQLKVIVIQSMNKQQELNVLHILGTAESEEKPRTEKENKTDDKIPDTKVAEKATADTTQ